MRHPPARRGDDRGDAAVWRVGVSHWTTHGLGYGMDAMTTKQYNLKVRIVDSIEGAVERWAARALFSGQQDAIDAARRWYLVRDELGEAVYEELIQRFEVRDRRRG